MTDNTLVVDDGSKYQVGDTLLVNTGERLQVVQSIGNTITVIRNVGNPDYEAAKALIREVCGEEQAL